MNKRIRELADQCTSYNDSDGWIFDKEKFAELIVKECVQSIEKTIETNCDTEEEKMGCEFAITDLLNILELKNE